MWDQMLRWFAIHASLGDGVLAAAGVGAAPLKSK
jgi:hypothetical protein